MQALVKEEPIEGYSLVEIPIPEPASDEVLIQVQAVSVCGSDINLYQWNSVAEAIAKLPFTPGHECAGVVHRLGSDVDEQAFPIGALVAVENHFFCGKCYQCQHDLRHICQQMAQFGHGRGTTQGGMAQFCVVKADYVYVLKEQLQPHHACLLEPFGVAHQAVEAVEVARDSLLVTGCGPVGLLSIGIAHALGATRIVASDVNSQRLEIAKSMGAHRCVNPTDEDLVEAVLAETGNDGVGAVIEASGANAVVDSVFRGLRKGGRVLMLGLPKKPIVVSTPLPDFIFKSITLKTIHGRKIWHTWEQSEKLVASGQIDLDLIISHDLPLSEYDKAHRILISGDACKIIVRPN